MEKTYNCQKLGPFTSKGTCDDEVQLLFDDGTTLFVSRNLLTLASPVFEAMFNQDFKEKNENCVKLDGKKYSDMLQFLMCIHPRIAKTLNQSNVLTVTPIAEEYQVTALIDRCKALLEQWLDECIMKASEKSFNCGSQCPLMKICLTILHLADKLGYAVLVEKCIQSAACFGINACIRKRTGFGYKFSKCEQECQELYSSLPMKVQLQIVIERLNKYDDNNFKLCKTKCDD